MTIFVMLSSLLPLLLTSTVWMTETAGLCILNDKGRMDLSDHNLTSVPLNLPKFIQYLDLSFNAINTLTSSDLSDLSALCIFKMTNCGLISISPTTFHGNPLLQELDLSFNALSVIPEIRGLSMLRVLDISENLYESFTLGQSLQNLQSLTSLSLGGPQVSRLDKLDLEPLTHFPLCELTLRTGTNLTHFNTDFLSYLSRIKTLTLQVNFCSTPKLFKDVLLALQLSSVDTLVIEKFLPEICDVAANLTDDLRNLGKLQHLVLKDSWFYSSLFSQALVHIIQSPLQTLSAQNCTYIQDTPEGLTVMTVQDFSKIGNLRVLHLNNIHHYQYTQLHVQLNLSLFQGLVKAELTGLRVGFPGSITNGVVGDLTSLSTLDVSNNNLAASNLWNKFNLPFQLFKNLKEVIIRNNRLESLSRVLQYVHIFLTNLETLDLSFNPIKLHDHERVIWPSHLKNLSLSGNLLGNRLFDHLSPHFVGLNLTHTDITSINLNVLNSMKDLKQLSIGSNAIRELSPELMLPALEELYADHNSINTLGPETFKGLPKLKKLNIGHNPFTCDCNLYWFINDFNKSLLVDWPAAYNCYTPASLTGISLMDFHPNKITCDPLLMFAICFPVVLFVLLLCSVVFYIMDGSWYAKMLWTWLRVKQRSRKKDKRLERSTFTYHAFISYSEKDAEWVRSELVPHLEASNVQLCLHERDFVPGEWVIDNIIRCVESSYKTVFVLSQSFVQSEWCNYELFFAQHRAIDVQEDSLVLILLEPIPQDSLSRKFLRLRSLLRQQTYLQWSKEESKSLLFWASLKALLRTGDKNVVADENGVLQQVAEDLANLCHNESEFTESDKLLNS